MSLVPCSLARRAGLRLLVLVCALVAVPRAGQEEAAAAEVPASLASPDATMRTFLRSMNDAEDPALSSAVQEAAWDEALATLDLSRISDDLGRRAARRLLLVLNRLGRYEEGTLWTAAEARERAAERQVYFPHPRFGALLAEHPDVEPDGQVVLERRDDGRWLFSAETVAGVDLLYASLEPLPILYGKSEEDVAASEEWLRSLVPEGLQGRRLLTLESWQWLGLFGLILVGVVLDHVVRTLLRRLLDRRLQSHGDSATKDSLRRTVRPAGLVVMALFWVLLVPILDLPGIAYTVVQGAARVFGVLAGALFAWRLTDLLAEVFSARAARTESKLDDVLIPLVRTTIRIFIVIVALIYAGLSLDLDVTPMLASLTIGGVGFAFAAKDTLENFFGSATVLIDQPFGVGDWVKIDDIEGTVETVGLRSTRIRTFYNSLVTVPNANLVRASVDNYGRRRYRRWKTTIGVQYDTTPDQLVAFTEGIRELIRAHPYTRKDYFQVRLTDFGPSSLDILLYVFYEAPEWSTELRERERLMLDVVRLADRLGVQFAFPTSTVHLHTHAPGERHEPSPPPGSTSERRAMVSGIRAAQELVSDQPWRGERPGPVVFREGPTTIDDDTFIEDRTSGS